MKFKDRFDLTIWWGVISLSKFKSFEYQFEGPSFMKDDVFEFKLAWTRKQDHAGPEFTFGIHRLFWCNLHIYDRRHWNYETNSWQTYEEIEK